MCSWKAFQSFFQKYRALFMNFANVYHSLQPTHHTYLRKKNIILLLWWNKLQKNSHLHSYSNLVCLVLKLQKIKSKKKKNHLKINVIARRRQQQQQYTSTYEISCISLTQTWKFFSLSIWYYSLFAVKICFYITIELDASEWECWRKKRTARDLI